MPEDVVVPNPTPAPQEGDKAETPKAPEAPPQEPEWKSKYSDLEKQYKTLQRKFDEANRKQVDSSVLAKGMAILTDAVLNPDNEAARTKLRATQVEKEAAETKAAAAMQGMAAITTRYGISEEQFGSEDFDDVRELWRAGNYDAALGAYVTTAKVLKRGEVKPVTTDKKTETTPVPNAQVDIEAAVQKRLRELGVDPASVDRKRPDPQVKVKRWAKSEMMALNDDEFVKNFDEINKAYSEGRVDKDR